MNYEQLSYILVFNFSMNKACEIWPATKKYINNVNYVVDKIPGIFANRKKKIDPLPKWTDKKILKALFDTETNQDIYVSEQVVVRILSRILSILDFNDAKGSTMRIDEKKFPHFIQNPTNTDQTSVNSNFRFETIHGSIYMPIGIVFKFFEEMVIPNLDSLRVNTWNPFIKNIF